MNDNLDYTQSSKISEREKLNDSFENWFSKLAYNDVCNKDWYKEQENIVIKHLNKKNTTVTKGIYEDIVPEFGTAYYVQKYATLIYSASINDKDYYKDLLELANITYSGKTDLSWHPSVSAQMMDAKCTRLLRQYSENIVSARSVLFKDVNFNLDFENNGNFKKQLFGVMKKMPTFKNKCNETFKRTKNLSNKVRQKNNMKAKVYAWIFGIIDVISMILAYVISWWFLIASAILLIIFIFSLFALKNSKHKNEKIYGVDPKNKTLRSKFLEQLEQMVQIENPPIDQENLGSKTR